MLTTYPVLLPVHQDLLKDPFNRDHPLLSRKQPPGKCPEILL